MSITTTCSRSWDRSGPWPAQRSTTRTSISTTPRDFARTNEAFRIRRIGDENRLTYKGPRLSGPTKTREEIEIPVAPGTDQFRHLLRLLENLGFRPVATVRKRRESYHLTFQEHELEIVLDTAEGLGSFAEIETIASGQADLPAAQQAVMALAELLGLTQVEPRSYLGMILESQARRPDNTNHACRHAEPRHCRPD